MTHNRGLVHLSGLMSVAFLVGGCWLRPLPKHSPTTIGLPLYPGGEIMAGGSSSERGEKERKPGQDDYLYIFTVPNAGPEKVTAFYREAMDPKAKEGWKRIINEQDSLMYTRGKKPKAEYITITASEASNKAPEGASSRLTIGASLNK